MTCVTQVLDLLHPLRHAGLDPGHDVGDGMGEVGVDHDGLVLDSTGQWCDGFLRQRLCSGEVNLGSDGSEDDGVRLDLLERRRSWERRVGVMLQEAILAKLLIKNIIDLLVFQTNVDHLGGFFCSHEVLATESALVLNDVTELEVAESVNVVSGAVVLQQSLPVLRHLTTQLACVHLDGSRVLELLTIGGIFYHSRSRRQQQRSRIRFLRQRYLGWRHARIRRISERIRGFPLDPDVGSDWFNSLLDQNIISLVMSHSDVNPNL